MEITERDLYNFIFCRSKISEDKAAYIESSGLFSEELNFFSLLKEKMAVEIPSEIKEKLALNISEYKFIPADDDSSSSGKTKRKNKNGN